MISHKHILRLKNYFFVLIFVSFIACNNNKKDNIKTYLFLSHTRIDKNSWEPNEIVENINYKNYDMLFLGGDIAKAPLKNEHNVKFLNKIFNFASSNTNWIVGNHEYWFLSKKEKKSMSLYKKYTHRNTYYAFSKDKATFVILNTQDSFSNIVGKQLQMLKNIADTISYSKNILIFHHKLIWLMDNGLLQDLKSFKNPPIGNCFDCLNPNNFYSDVYPLLLKIKNKGINVFCIGGDIGFARKKFDYVTKEGIRFLANGIKGFDSYRGDNYALIIRNNLNTNSLSFSFVELWKLQYFDNWQKKKIKQQMNIIKSDSILFFNSVYRSLKYNHTIEQQIHIDAISQLDKAFRIFKILKNSNKNIKFIKKYDINYKKTAKNKNDYLFCIAKKLVPIVNKIETHKQWYKQIKIKAEKNNIIPEKQEIADALFVLYKE
jgi:hypothetical protein